MESPFGPIILHSTFGTFLERMSNPKITKGEPIKWMTDSPFFEETATASQSYSPISSCNFLSAGKWSIPSARSFLYAS
jgi:hypothetical protein